MENENDSRRPLDSLEIRTGTAQKAADAVFDAVFERLGKSCNLYGAAYPRFKTDGSFRISLLMSRLFEEGQAFENDAVVDNHEVSIPGDVGEDPIVIEVEVNIPAMPPNQFRMETDQPIVKTVVEDGRTVEKKVRYQARQKKGK